MTKVLFIYGPRGCGKTANKDRFLNHYKNFGYTAIYEEAHFFDNTTKQLSKSIVLCTEEPDDQTLKAYGATKRSFDDAMHDSQPPVENF